MNKSNLNHKLSRLLSSEERMKLLYSVDIVPHSVFRTAVWIYNRKIMRRIADNQSEIIAQYKSAKATPVLTNKALVGGHIEHFYHFIFEFVLPIIQLIEKSPSDIIFYSYDIGPLTPCLKEIFGDRIQIVSRNDDKFNEMGLMGMDPIGMRRRTVDLEILRNFLFDKFKIQSSTISKKIILIQRREPDPYYMTQAKNKGAGSQRRSIVNFEEVASVIKKSFSKSHEIVHLILEDLSIEEQVCHFNAAWLVIGLHGAGLANIVWMKKKSHVVEIGFRSRSHFKRISQILGHNHYIYKNFDQRHIEIDKMDFQRWINSKFDLHRKSEF